MKIAKIKELFEAGKPLNIKGRGKIIGITEKDGKYTIEYDSNSQGVPKYYGRLTICSL